jgi:hypothetical protein
MRQRQPSPPAGGALLYGLLAVVLSAGVALLARRFDPEWTTTPLFEAPGRVYYLVALAAAFGYALFWEVREQRAFVNRPVRFENAVHPLQRTRRGLDWLVPCTLLIAVYGLMVAYDSWSARALLVLLAGIGCWAAARLDDWRSSSTPQWSSGFILTGVVAYLAFTMVYGFKAPASFAVPATFLFGFTLTNSLFSRLDGRPSATLLFSSAIAIGLAQGSWALTYWRLNQWIGGVVLTIGFVLSAELVARHLRGELNERTALVTAGAGLSSLCAIILLDVVV